MTPLAVLLLLLSDDGGGRADGIEASSSAAPAGDVPESSDDLLLATKGKAASLDTLAPPSLPPLTHADASLDLDYTCASVGQGSFGDVLTWMAYARAEIPLTTRAWHAGIAWDFASAAADGVGRALVVGNPEVWVRGMGWHESGLGAGGGLGLVIPIPRDRGEAYEGKGFVRTDKNDAQTELDVVRVIRPWDSSYFENDMITLRPSFDARLVLEPFVLQLRQGLDWSYSFTQARADVAGRWGTYLAIAPTPWFSAGLEFWQTYVFTKTLPDNERAAFSLSPALRFKLGPVQPGVSLVFPVSTPLEGIATDYFAVRAHVRLALGETAAVTLQK